MLRALKLHDPWIYVFAGLATLMGLFFIFDAGYARSVQGDRGVLPPEFMQQFKYIVASCVAWVLGTSIGKDKWQKGSWVVLLINFGLLFAVMAVGTSMNGAKRWVFGVQPSEFMKIATVVYLASVFANRKPWPKLSPRRDWAHWLDTVMLPKLVRCLPGFLILAAVMLIEKEPDLGTGAVVAVTAFSMFILGGVSRKTLVVGVLLGLLGAYVMVRQEPYRWDRIVGHMHRWEAKNVDADSYQTVQSELAMATGGVFGVGVGAGRAKHVLPATTTDFIMATVAEEFGLVGALAVLGVLAALTMRLIYLAQRAASPYARLVLGGVACWFGIQTCVNVMMANAFMPAIGIPLPFFSSGGSSLVALWLAIGVCNSVLAPAPEKKEVEGAIDSNRGRDRRPHLSRA